jgi:hypothetical protein
MRSYQLDRRAKRTGVSPHANKSFLTVVLVYSSFSTVYIWQISGIAIAVTAAEASFLNFACLSRFFLLKKVPKLY